MSIGFRDASALCRPLAQSDIDYLISKGVPPLALACTWDGTSSPIVRAHVVETAPHRFEFAEWMRGEAGQSALIIEALDAFGEVSDLIAWNRYMLASWLGRSPILGEEQLAGFRMVDHVKVHETVLAWLAEGRDGVVVIDEGRAGELLRPVPMVAASVQHGRRLRRICTPPAPRILVPTIGQRAAA